MLRDSDGNRLFRKIEMKIIYPDNIMPPKTISQRAEAHKGFGPAGLDDVLMQVTDRLDSLYPWWDFRYVALSPVGRTARYVFTFAGYRAGAFPGAMSPEASAVEFTQPGFTEEHP